MTPVSFKHRSIELPAAPVSGGVLGASLLWAYWPTLRELERTWSRDPRYSHGYLVAAFALYLLWLRRHSRPDHARPNVLGLLLFTAAAGLRIAGAYYYFTWFDMVSILVSLAGLCLVLGGWAALRWAWPSIAFLIFMIPLPYSVESALGSRLQWLATVSSTYVLQLFGLPAFSSGNTIVIDNYTIGIVDACNGLGASYAVLACATGAVLMTQRPFLDKIIVLLSAIPIAIVTNTTRVTLTGLLHETMGPRVSDSFYHDLAGWLTMPLALAALYVVFRLLQFLFVETDEVVSNPAAHVSDHSNIDEHCLDSVRRSRSIATSSIIATFAIVVASSVVHGSWTNRWKISHDLELAIARLARVPTSVGDWHASDVPLDRREYLAAGLDGVLSRSYENHESGTKITVLIVCGRPGPVSVHTPDVCYPGAGFEMIRSHPVQLSGRREVGRAEFLTADFENHELLPPEQVRVWWSWNSNGEWRVPENPRLTFASSRYLYKIYLVSRSSTETGPAVDQSFSAFLQKLLPELDNVLFPRDTPDL